MADRRPRAVGNGTSPHACGRLERMEHHMKNTWKRLVALLLAFVLAICAAACRNNQEPAQTTETGTGEQTGNEAVWLDLLSAGGDACGVYYPAGAEPDVIGAAQQLAASVGALCGQSVSPESDDRIPAQPGAMILVGWTCRPESGEFYATLGYSDYGHAVVAPNVLCVGGHSASNTVKAAKSLSGLLNAGSLPTEKLLADGSRERGGVYLSSEQNARVEASYPIEALTVEGQPLSDFVLVYEPEQGRAAAERLQHLVGIATGVCLPLKNAAETPEAAFEILVGNTGRELTAGFYAQSYHQNYNQYQLLIAPGKLALVGASEVSLGYALDAFSALLSGSGSRTLNASDSVSGSLPGSAWSVSDRPDTSDLRVASNNVYFYEYTLTRAAQLLESCIYLDADVLLLQEMSVDWHLYLDAALSEIGYTQVPTKANPELGEVPDRLNYTPIYYRAEKLTLVECGYDQFESVKARPDGDLSSSKSYTWALFEEQATGKRFVAISTHYTWYGDPVQANSFRVADAQEIMAAVEGLERQYACPIIVMGDLNCTVNSDPYNVMAEGGLLDARYHADRRENINISTWHELGQQAGSGSGGILDHCFFSGEGLHAKLFQVVHNSYAVQSSDHLPIVLDASLD